MVAQANNRNTADSLQAYWRDIRRCEPLSRAEEAQLVERAHAGDDEAMQALVSANLRFVVRVARDYARSDMPLGELISAGNLGLMRAVSSFDAKRGHKFITYAVWWIRQAMCKAMDSMVRDVRRPSNQLLDMKHVENATRRLEQQLGRAPSVDELTKETGYVRDRMRNAIESGWGEVSLDIPAGADPQDAPLDLLPSADNAIDEDYERRELRALLHESLAALSSRERRVLDAYYGLGGVAQVSLERIGLSMGLTRERVRQIRDCALNKIRARQGTRLIEYCRN